MLSNHLRLPFIKVVTTLIVVTAGIYYMTSGSSIAQDSVMPAAPTVEVTTLQLQSVRTWTNFSGRLSAVDSADIKPLVSGEITQVLFEDGQEVKKDAPLFVIDPRPYEATVKRAQAQLASATSRAKLAKDERNRTQRLIDRKLISASVHDTAHNEYQMASAAISEAESNLVQARLSLEYSHITAPFDGRISRAELTEGNIVETGSNAPILATLVSHKKLYAEFNVDEQTYIKSVRSSLNTSAMPVELTLAAEDSVVYKGHIHSFDNRLNSSSGTIRARATFENIDGVLTPGMFANIRLGSTTKTEVLLIPQRAVGTNQNKKFVYIVNAENKATYREVTLGQYHNDYRVILSGLHPGERIVVNGLSHISPNMIVTSIPANNIPTKTGTED